MTGTQLILLRHGQTEYSAKRLYAGRSDPPLTEVGTRQITAAAARLATGGFGDIDRIITSPLIRCVETAEKAQMLCDEPLSCADDLSEIDFGEWDGLTFAQARRRDPHLHELWMNDENVSPPGGESHAAVYKRVNDTIDELVKAHRGCTLLIVSHMGPIKAILRRAMGVGPSINYQLFLDLASISTVTFYADGRSSARVINDSSHWRG